MRCLFFIFSICVPLLGFSQTPAESLQRLIEGNQRYISDQLQHPNHSQDRREEISSKQKPFAAILGCSDSRVAPEIIFDQGLGDLFTVRVAGNVVDPVILDSIEYAAKYLGASLILVLGHESCGAVSNVYQGTTADIEQIASLIQPAIKGAKSVDTAVKDNIRWSVARLKDSTLLKRLLVDKKIDVVGAYYNLNSGAAEILY